MSGGFLSPPKKGDLKRVSLATGRFRSIRQTRFDGEPVFVCQKLIRTLHEPALTVKPFVYKDLTMNLGACEGQRFVRRTQLAPEEYRKNFHQIDCEVMAAITSAEADRITPLMSKIYLRLVNAPTKFWEREGVLRVEAEVREGKLLKAWAVLCELAGVSSATASKALRWMHEQGIIGYFSGKNGVGLRIFLNRAASSIGVRPGMKGKKILAFPPASNGRVAASANEAAFSDSFAVKESSDESIKSRAPKDSADDDRRNQSALTPTRPSTLPTGGASLDEVVKRLRVVLEPSLHAVARQAAAYEHERTRDWLEKKGLPKAARVAQHEAYNILRKHGVIGGAEGDPRTRGAVGRCVYERPEPQPLSEVEVAELAEACLAMLEAKGQSIEITLSEISNANGGFLLPEDVCRVRERAMTLRVSNDCKGN